MQKQAATDQKPRRAKARKAANRYSKTVLRWLVFCFPAGLLMMWGSRCRWTRAVKCAVSAFYACLLIAVVLPQTLPPEKASGGVKVVGRTAVVELQGPVQEEETDYDYELVMPSYTPPSIVIEPTPTPLPIYVYCNQGGKYYHMKDCKYFKNTSGRVTLGQALSAGYTRCQRCNPPSEEDEILYQ